MIDLGQTEFRLAVPSVESGALERMSNALFDEWAEYVGNSLNLRDYSLFLQVDEGSINGWGRIKTGAKFLFVGVSAYGGFYAGLEVIGKQLGATGDFLAEHAQKTFACPQAKATTRKSGGVPTYLRRLFARVQRGELTSEEATVLAEKMLADDASESPELLNALAAAFRNCSRNPEQIPLPLNDDDGIQPAESIKDKSPKSPKPRVPDQPPPVQYRVEVWRESKRNRKTSKVSPL